MPISRDKNGRFVKGNKSGGRKPQPKEFKDACLELTLPALEVIKGIMLDKEQSPQVRLRAAEIILDRAFGKPQQAVQVEQADTTIRIIDSDPEGTAYNA